MHKYVHWLRGIYLDVNLLDKSLSWGCAAQAKPAGLHAASAPPGLSMVLSRAMQPEIILRAHLGRARKSQHRQIQAVFLSVRGILVPRAACTNMMERYLHVDAVWCEIQTSLREAREKKKTC